MSQIRIIAEYLQLFLGVVTFIGIVYQFAKIEHKIYLAIDKNRDDLWERCTVIENKLALHIVECDTRAKTDKYSIKYLVVRLQNLEEKVDLMLGESNNAN
ncbi:hypothetical protein [Calothrix sp. 336/3]|uniref:hypothetical protein n=1 Tax=Calothrix sp. 336/3 TaxID=1337936 RepID=UPI0006243FF3|nr:hypothetical protein [Calothrix sp. 336/3]AKG21267.1 hypothetical protein IJ00_08110 [Calothrix sp. 336/3]